MRHDDPVLAVSGLSVAYGRTTVVEGVSFTLARGQTLGLVGESGSGKSTVAKAVVGLLRCEGDVVLDGIDLRRQSRRRLRALRRRVQLVPQDPYASLNPRMTVGAAIAEALGDRPRRERSHAVAELLETVALDAAAAAKHPHEFSGGQRQRIAIARALAAEPDVVIADEITSALDCSVQAGVLELLHELRARRELAMVFISHDLAVVSNVADAVAVMRHGRIVEQGPLAEVFGAPRTDYARLLLDAVPQLDTAGGR
ncbi:ABC transporter ATP-binding protein [Conexibacter woesei]|nr:ATP-binding cassette domain-containing protein [Conexibacter woesei]